MHVTDQFIAKMERISAEILAYTRAIDTVKILSDHENFTAAMTITRAGDRAFLIDLPEVPCAGDMRDALLKISLERLAWHTKKLQALGFDPEKLNGKPG